MSENTGPLPSVRELERHPVARIIRDVRSGARVTDREIDALGLSAPAKKKLIDAVAKFRDLRAPKQVEYEDPAALGAEVPGFLGGSYQPVDEGGGEGESEDAPPKRAGASAWNGEEIEAAYPGALESVFSAMTAEERSPDYFTPDDDTPSDPGGLADRVGGHCF